MDSRLYIFPKVWDKNQSGVSDFESFRNDFHLAQMNPKLGAKEGYFKVFQAKLRNHLGRVKFFLNDPE